MKLKQRPEDFSVVESWRFEPARHGDHFVYRMDKQKLSTLAAVERLHAVRARLDEWLALLEAPGGPDAAAIRERLDAARARLEG